MGNEVQIILSAVDRASGEIGKVQNSMNSLGGFAKGVFKASMVVGAAGLTALGAGLGYSIKEAMEAQEVQAQLANVLKSTGGAAGVTADMANDLATAFSQTTRFGDETVLSGENMLLTFTNIGKDIFPQATEAMLDMSQALGQDIKSSAIQLGKALNDPVQGITALQRVGVSFTDEQKKMVEGMVEAGDVMGAQKFILAELQKEFGGSAVAAGQTFAGQLDILKNSLSNVAEGIGTALLPILQQFLNDVIMPMIPTIQSLAEKFGWLLEALVDAGPLSSEFGEALTLFFSPEAAANIQEVIGKVIEIAGAIRDFITDIVIPFVQEHSKAFKAAFIAIGAVLVGAAVLGAVLTIAGAIASLMNPITLIIAGVALLAAAWTENWGGIREKTQAVIDFIQPYIKAFLDAVQGFWDTHGEEIMAAVRTAWETIQTTVETVANAISDFISGALAAIKAFWDAHGEAIMAAAEFIWNAIKATIETVLGIVESLWKAWQAAREGDWTAFGENLRDAWDTAWEAIKKVLTLAWEAIKIIIGDLVEGIKSKFANTDWGQVGKNIIQGIIDGIVSMAGTLAKAAANAAKNALDAAKGFFSGGGGGGGGTTPTPPRRIARAAGGFVGAGMPYLVGEQGPEMFVPSQSGTIIPNNIVNNFYQTVNTNAQSSTVIEDFNLMRALAGV